MSKKKRTKYDKLTAVNDRLSESFGSIDHPGARQLEQVREVQRNNFSNAPEYRRVWNERKASFDPGFVEWMEQNVVDSK